jgi:drug/metabolite transporter (DMT)-like permease
MFSPRFAAAVAVAFRGLSFLATEAALVLGEQVSAMVVAGGVLVLASVLIAQYAPRVAPSMEEA